MPRRVYLPMVSYPGESLAFSESELKEQSDEIFDLFFFQNSSLPGPMSNSLKYFRFWLRFLRVIQIVCKNLSGNHTRRVTQDPGELTANSKAVSTGL